MFSSRKVYAVILAGEEDARLASLTRALSVSSVPKQYAFIAGEGSLLQQTVASYATSLPPERIIVVATSKWQELARAQLRKWRGTSVLARPRDCEASLDLALGLGRVMACDPHAAVVVAPADAYVPRANALLASLGAAEPALATVPVILVGVPMNGAIAGERLVVPGPRRAGRVLSVRRLVEHLPPEDVQRWKASGALWDTSIVLARAETLWRLAMQKMPGDVATAAGLARVANTPGLSLSVLDRPTRAGKPASTRWQSLDDLGVVAVHGSGWSAWSSPEQVMDSIRDPVELEKLLSRIYQQQWGLDRVQLRRQFRREARDWSVPSCAVLDQR
jgi:mannose-1-phosphate guanylyltransferase